MSIDSITLTDRDSQETRAEPPFGADTGWIPIKMKAIQIRRYVSSGLGTA